jgi:hypothetical protein
MKQRIVLPIVAGFLASVSTTFGQPVLAVDFQPTTGVAAPGYEIWDGGSAAGSSATPQSRTFGPYTVDLAPVGTGTLGFRVRATPVNTTGFTQSEIFRDFVFGAVTAGQQGLSLTISGLTPSAEYHFKFYSVDTGSGARNRISDWYANNVQVVYRYAFLGASTMSFLDDQYTFSFNATADSTGQIVIQGLPAETTHEANPAAFINGFEMFEGARAINPPREVFWTETGGFVEGQGSVWSVGRNGVGRTPVAIGLSRPIGIALDPVNRHVYWAEDGFGSQPSRIVRANYDGSEQTVLFNEVDHGFTNAQMLALDLANGHVYWTDHFKGVIRGNLDGTGYTVLGGSAATYTALALDLVNGHIYYGEPSLTGVLFRMDLDGQNNVEIARDIANVPYNFNAIALDVPNGHIYYTLLDANEIKRMDLDGSNQVTLLTDAGLLPHGITLAGDRIYWVGGFGQRLGTAKLDGTTDVKLRLASHGSNFGFGVAALVQLRITNISLAGSNVNITWQGDAGPYQLQRRASLTQGDWENVGAPTTANQATDTITGDSMFYRVVEVSPNPSN